MFLRLWVPIMIIYAIPLLGIKRKQKNIKSFSFNVGQLRRVKKKKIVHMVNVICFRQVFALSIKRFCNAIKCVINGSANSI